MTRCSTIFNIVTAGLVNPDGQPQDDGGDVVGLGAQTCAGSVLPQNINSEAIILA